jgi:hypothetical protein
MMHPIIPEESTSLVQPQKDDEGGLQATSSTNQLKVLLRRGFIKTVRDQTLTYLRVLVNVFVGLMLGTLYWQAGRDGTKVLDNYNLLFSILMHHMMSTMMLTILTFPNEMSILIKEHFNRWYSLKMYYASVTLIDIPVSVRLTSHYLKTVLIYLVGCLLCTLLDHNLWDDGATLRTRPILHVLGHQYASRVCGAKFRINDRSRLQRCQWYFSGTNVISTNDDVCRFWSHFE